MDGGDYSDGITKTPIVIDNVTLPLFYIELGIWNHQSRLRWRRSALEDI